MKFFFRFFFTLGFFLCLYVGNVSSQGVLIFELSDARNKAIPDLPINVFQGDSLFKSYVTDADGRVVDASFPSGLYSYSFDYGDLSADTFSVTDANYTWINLDYRVLQVSFKDDMGKPLTEKRTTVYKVNADETKTLVGEKYSDQLGITKFVLPEGDYMFSTFKGDSTIHLEDENINSEVEVTSGQITHSYHFRFVKNGEQVAILTKEFEVTYYGEDSVYHYGSADVAPSPSARSINGFYETSISSTPISLCAGTFVVSVTTKDYGSLSDTIVVDDNLPLKGNVHDFILKDIPGSGGEGGGEGGGGGDEGGGGGDDDEDDDEDEPKYHLTIRVFSAEDSITPLARIPVVVAIPSRHKRSGTLSNEGGYAYYKAEGTVDIYALNDTLRNFEVTSDTMASVYVDVHDATIVYFDFYYGKEKFTPTSIKDIVVWDSQNSDIYFSYPSSYSEEKYSIVDSILMMPGDFSYSFYISEKGYDQRINKKLTVHESDTVIHAETVLTPYHKLTIELLDINGHNFESRQFIQQIVGITSLELLTDSLGRYTNVYLEGSYTFSALGETKTVDLTSDTTIYFQHRAEKIKHVYFQFLHDGKLVYPQIMNMDIYKGDSTKYSRINSTFYENYKGHENVWVFDQSAICETGDYFVTYELKDYDFKGIHSRYFDIFANTQESDTVIYIVVPVKRTVTISVRDANLELLQGVNANIYKYDENGNLLPTPFFDDMSHEGIRTNVDGQVIDLLTPGRYQLRIIDIVRDFIVKDYDLNFEVVSGAKMFDVKYVTLYKETNMPASDLLLDIKKNGSFYNSSYTDEKGTVEIFCEKGNYSYYLHYGVNHSGSFELKSDTTIYIYLENPVFIDSIYVAGCVCVSHGDTIPLDFRIHPDNATIKEIEWEVDNPALAQVSSDNKLIVNNIPLDGFFTLTAKAVDKGKMIFKKRYHVGADCGTSFSLGFEGTEDVDMPISSESVNLIVKPDVKDAFDNVFLYQISSDSINWRNLSEPTTDTLISVSTLDISKYAYFRALISSSKEEMAEFVKSGASDCGVNKTTNSLILRYNKLAPTNWTDSICSNHGDLYFSINRQSLDELPAGYQIEWATKKLGDVDYKTIEGMSGKDTLQIAFDSTSFVRVAIQKGDNILISYEQKVFVEQLPSITMNQSRDTVCLNDTVRFSVTVNEGQIASYVWSASPSNESAVTLNAQNDSYSVIANSFYGLCPAQYDTARLVVDKPIDIQVYADQATICETQTEGTVLRVDRMSNQIGAFTWNDQSKADTLRVTPSQTSSYSVEATSLYDRCPRVEKNVSVEVRNSLAVQLSVDVDDICQMGADSVTLTAKVLSGGHYHYIWWDSTETDVAERTVLFNQSVSPWVMIRDSICADSEKDYVDIRVAHPSEASIRTTTKVFEYGSSIDLVAESTNPVIGPYTWYSIDANGDEVPVSTTDTASYSDFPKGDVSYYVLVENGACPTLYSNKISAHLTDNIVIPTLFTPYTIDGFNDDFMPGYRVIIYDRYGNIVCNSTDGWDGTYRGDTAEPGVYMYVITLKDERVVKGTIEVFRK